MPATFLLPDNNNTPHRRRRIRLTDNPLLSQTDLITSSSSSSKKSNNRKNSFTTASFRTLGCTASSQVSVPASIRSSANWEAKNVRKKNQSRNNPTDVWCLPAIALTSTADTATSFDRIDKKKKKTNLREREEEERSYSSTYTRRMGFQGSNNGFGMPHHGLDEFRPRSFHHHVRRRSPSPEGLSEIVLIQGGRLTGARVGGLDRYQEWRLNVDDMSYEDLLELGERIGSVNTGLKEDEIVQCLRKLKISSGTRGQVEEEDDLLEHNCSICQEEYGEEDEMGELDCGHFFHSHCIEQWLVRKNSCPICKTAAIAAE